MMIKPRTNTVDLIQGFSIVLVGGITCVCVQLNDVPLSLDGREEIIVRACKIIESHTLGQSESYSIDEYLRNG
jgi:hypothetical protein